MKPPRGARPAGRRIISRSGETMFVRTGVSRLTLPDPYAFAVGLGWAGFAALFVSLEVVINGFFGLLYYLRPEAVANLPPGQYLDAFFFSVETLATVGYGVMAPITPYAHVVTGIEIVFGTAFTAIMTGLTFVRFSKPRPRILYADQVVVARHNGEPTLMLRIANGRAGMMTEASARLSVLLPERSSEGQFFRRPHDLALVRDRLPLFAITWTLMHPISPGSPLHGMDMATMRELGLRLFLTIEARDAKLDLVVHDLHDWAANQIAVGMRYADTITFDEAGRPIADLSRVSALQPDVAPPADPPP